MADADAEVAKPKRPRRPREPSFVDSPDPIEIAMKAVATGADRHSAARAVLEKHGSLIDKQCAREDEELRILRLRRFTRWLILLAVAAALLGLGAAVWAASRSNSLVIEPFEVPVALEQRGITGTVVSARVLDRLAELQRNTESIRGEKAYADNWRDDIKLAIPETGMSFGDAWRALKGWLGEETRISGEVVQIPTGLAISTRAGSTSGEVVEGTEAAVDELIRAAARSIYKATQPYRYAISLRGDPQGEAERLKVLTGLTGHSSATERKWAFSGLSATYRELGEVGKAKAMAQRALAIDPDLLPAIGNLGSAEYYLGHDEAALRLMKRWLNLQEQAESGEYDGRLMAANKINDSQQTALLLGDPAEIELQANALEQLGALTTFASALASFRAEAALLRHDHARAARLYSPLLSSADPQDAAWARSSYGLLLLEAASDLGDVAAVRRHAAALENAARQLPGPAAQQAGRLRTQAAIGLALGRVGAAAEATQRAAVLPSDCYPCLRAQGWAASASGDRAGAERYFRDAIRQAPSIPFGYADLGELLLQAGDVNRAQEQFRLANLKAPNWPDALKLMGDAFASKGDGQSALTQYAKAASLAPHWGALHLAWANVQLRTGDEAGARQKLRAASKMTLSAEHRRRLGTMWKLAVVRS